MTVKQLRSFLHKQSLSTSGSKVNLAERVKDYVIARNKKKMGIIDSWSKQVLLFSLIHFKIFFKELYQFAVAYKLQNSGDWSKRI